MSTTITGVVTNGVVVTHTALPEGANAEILLKAVQPEVWANLARIPPDEFRKLPREERRAILAAAAELAEQDYRDDKELTGFDALSEEEVDDNESDAE